MTGILLLAAAIPLAALIRRRLEPRRYVARPTRLLTDDAEAQIIAAIWREL